MSLRTMSFTEKPPQPEAESILFSLEEGPRVLN